MKTLGLDLGTRTLGIAISDALGMMAHGVETFRFEENHYKKAINQRNFFKFFLIVIYSHFCVALTLKITCDGI